MRFHFRQLICLCVTLLICMSFSLPAHAGGETLTIMVYDRGNMNAAYGTPTHNAWTAYIQHTVEKELNIQVEFVSVSRSNDVSQLSIMMANKTAPDIVFTYDQTMWLQMCETGLATDLTELLPTSGKNILQHLETVLPYGQYNGRQMGLCNLRAVTDASCSFIRKDWLDQLGIVLKKNEDGIHTVTPEELHAILLRFQQENLGGQGTTAPAFYSFGTTYWPVLRLLEPFYQQDQLTEEDLFALPFFLYPGAKEGYRYLNRLYNDGLLNSDFAFIGDYDKNDYNQAISTGRIGFWVNDPWYGMGNDSLLTTMCMNDPKAEVVAVDILTPEGQDAYKYEYNDVGLYVFVPSFSQKAEAAVRYLNLWADPDYDFVLRFGFENEHYAMIDGLPTVIDEDYNSQTRISVADLALMYNGCAYMDKNLDARLGVQMYPTSQQELRRQAYYVGTRNGFQVPLISHYIPEAIAHAETLEHLERELRISCIMCSAESFDQVWEKQVSNYLNAGGQLVIDAKREAYRINR